MISGRSRFELAWLCLTSSSLVLSFFCASLSLVPSDTFRDNFDLLSGVMNVLVYSVMFFAACLVAVWLMGKVKID